MADLLDLQFLTVVGKGGVGKSTVSAALAMAAAKRGKRVLIALCNAKEHVSRMLEVPPLGKHNREVLPRIDAVNMEPAAALEEYGMMVLKLRALYRVIFENRLVASFLRGTPGLEAWSMLGKAQFHAAEQTATGRPRYDLVILDAPATGHGLEMLRVPRVIIDVAPAGLLRREAEKAWALFTDPTRSGVCLVSLPEELPTSETLELHAAIRDELQLPVSHLFINRVLPRLFAPEERPLVSALANKLAASSPIQPLSRAGHARSVREAIQEANIQRQLDNIPVDHTTLPLLWVPELRRDAIGSLADRLATSLQGSRV